MKTVLSIAGSDPSGGAGIQADLKTFSAFGLYGMSVISALTAQNTRGVLGIEACKRDFFLLQLKAVFDDIVPDAIKTGMLFNKDIVSGLADFLDCLDSIPPMVIDPVMIAKGGSILLQEDAIRVIKDRLFPHAVLITPNIPEAETLAKIKITDREAKLKACSIILNSGAKAILIKGGHEDNNRIEDLLVHGDHIRAYYHKRVRGINPHGTGCTLSSAIASCLALGFGLEESIEKALDYVYKAILNAPHVGHGNAPLNHNVDTEK